MDDAENRVSTPPSQPNHPNDQPASEQGIQIHGINLVPENGPSSFSNRFPTRAQLVGASMEAGVDTEVLNLGPNSTPTPISIPFPPRPTVQESIDLPSALDPSTERITLVSEAGPSPFSIRFPPKSRTASLEEIEPVSGACPNSVALKSPVESQAVVPQGMDLRSIVSCSDLSNTGLQLANVEGTVPRIQTRRGRTQNRRKKDRLGDSNNEQSSPAQPSSDPESMAEPIQLTPFERMRAANIQKNQAALEALGLTGPSSFSSMAKDTRPKSTEKLHESDIEYEPSSQSEGGGGLTEGVSRASLAELDPGPIAAQSLPRFRAANKKKEHTQRKENSSKHQQEPPKEEPQYSNADAIETLALHLVCTNAYHQVMRSDKKSVVAGGIHRKWLCKVPISGKSRAFNSSDAFWLKHYSSHNLEEKVIARAEELFDSVPTDHVPTEDWDLRRAMLPAFDLEWNSLRGDLFFYQELRRDIIDLQKRCSEQFYQIATGDSDFLSEAQQADIPQATLKKLFNVQGAGIECRQKLTSTTMENATIEAIDGLLSVISSEPSSTPGAMFPGKCQHGMAIRWIMSTYDFSPEEPWEFMLSKPWTLLRHKHGLHGDTTYALHPTKFQKGARPTRTDQPIEEPLGELDTILAGYVDMVLKEIDRTRFNANFKAFNAIRIRLPEMLTRGSSKKSLAETRDEWGRVQAGHMESADLLHDNIFHAQALKSIILEKLQHHPAAQLKYIEQTWLRLIAIIAICFGCTSEPAFFLTTMDMLLDQLRYHIGLSFDIFSETVAGKLKIFNLTPQSTSFTVGSKTFADIVSAPCGESLDYDPVLLEDHEYRMTFGELARCVRGSVVAAVYTTKAFYKMPPFEVPARFIFQSLLGWKATCATCGLEIHLPEGKLPPRPVAIGMMDIRVGNKLIRSSVSENRRDVYMCFSGFTFQYGITGEEARLWSHALGPFFFYFATLHHPSCKMFREKDMGYA
ncbi:hypothetical protein N431DRAFT_465547 [Stipitochalara longipes BDJ]|nr:hypothetical protein N431DRAFT_465547 [Stipitochalara longipes BDJ]